MAKVEYKIIFCDLDNTLIPFDSTKKFIANNRKRLFAQKKYYKVKNIFHALFSYLKVKFGLPIKNILFFKNESESLIMRLIRDEFKDDIVFNPKALDIIKAYRKIIVLTGSPIEIANVVLGNLTQKIKKKIEVIGMRLEKKNGIYTGKVLEHPIGFNKSKIIRRIINDRKYDGMGNSAYDLLFLKSCDKAYFYSNNIVLKIITKILLGRKALCFSYETTKNSLQKIIYRLSSFSLIGILITVGSLILSIFLLGVLKTPLYATYIFVYLGSIGLSYILNAKVTFKTAPNRRSALLYFFNYGISLLLGLFLLKIFREKLNWENYMIGIMPIPFTFCWNFTISHLIFKIK
jgi:phosphoserine phosphatase/putative flippase GtrA